MRCAWISTWDTVLPIPVPAVVMSATSTNLHFHGLTVPPVCHQDEVLRTSIQASDPPSNTNSAFHATNHRDCTGYHPHIHGFSAPQVMGGASGALIIEGLERAVPEVAGLPERVLVIRDQDLLNPDAPASRLEPVVPKNLIDRDGDAANNGTGFGKPGKGPEHQLRPRFPIPTIRRRSSASNHRSVSCGAWSMPRPSPI